MRLHLIESLAGQKTLRRPDSFLCRQRRLKKAEQKPWDTILGSSATLPDKAFPFTVSAALQERLRRQPASDDRAVLR